MWKWIVGILVVFVGVCGVGGYFAARSPQVKEMVKGLTPQEKALEVRLEKVVRGDLVRTINAPGLIEPKTNVKISAQVSARITALPFKAGDAVKAGDVVVRLDSKDLAANLESSQAQLRAEEARREGAVAFLKRAGAEMKRQRDLHASSDAAQASLESAEAEFLQAESTLEQAEQAIEIARANIQRAEKMLADTVIVSPIDGRITTLDAEVGETVVVGTLNNPGSVIMEIADTSVMLMKARVDETNVAPVRTGQRCRIYINAYAETVFAGAVERIELLRKIDARDGTGHFEVEVLMDKSPGDLAGLNANVDIEVETQYDVIRVPSQAVLDRRVDELPAAVVEGSANVDKNKPFARVVYAIGEDGKTRPIPVRTGSSDLTHTVITSGLNEGETIITGPYKILVALKHDQKAIQEGTGKEKETALASGAGGKATDGVGGGGGGAGGGAGAEGSAQATGDAAGSESAKADAGDGTKNDKKGGSGETAVETSSEGKSAEKGANGSAGAGAGGGGGGGGGAGEPRA